MGREDGEDVGSLVGLLDGLVVGTRDGALLGEVDG